MGDSFDWMTDVQIQNGFRFRESGMDVRLNRPLGVGVVTGKKWVVYCRVLE